MHPPQLPPPQEEPEPIRIPQERDQLVPPIGRPPTAVGAGALGEPPGERVPFEIEREMRRWSKGATYLGRERPHGKPAIIKVVRTERVSTPTPDQVLHRLRTFMKTSHPHLVPIESSGHREGMLYYVRAFASGETLAARLAAGSLSRREVQRLGRDLLDALAALHQGGVAHGNVKPNNIFFVSGDAVLTDPAVVRRDLSGETNYIPPERVTASDVTPQDDIYAVGAVLFEALSGRMWVMARNRNGPDWSRVPRVLARVLRRALVESPEKRWPDIAAFRAALSRAWFVSTTLTDLIVGDAVLVIGMAGWLSGYLRPLAGATLALIGLAAGRGGLRWFRTGSWAP